MGHVVRAADHDLVLLAPGDHELAVVDEGQVTGAEPAVGVEGGPVGLGVAVVAAHHRHAADLQFADAVLGEDRSGGVDDPDGHPGQGRSDRGEGHRVLAAALAPAGKDEVPVEGGGGDDDRAGGAVLPALPGVRDPGAGLRHAPGGSHGVGAQAVRLEQFQEAVAVRRDHGLAAVGEFTDA